MDSPVRKMLKKNDYNRHKLLRKIKRRNKAAAEKDQHAAEKALKKKLRVTPPKYDDGKLTIKEYANPEDIHVNPDGTVTTRSGNTGDVILPEVTIRPLHLEYKTVDKVNGDDLADAALSLFDLNRKYHYGPESPMNMHGLETVSPEFDALMLGRSLLRPTAGKSIYITSENAANATDEMWDAAYKYAISKNNIKEAQRLRDLHFLIKADNPILDESGNPLTTYHTVGDKYDFRFNEFNPEIEGQHSGIFTTDNPVMSASYASKVTSKEEQDGLIEAIRQRELHRHDNYIGDDYDILRKRAQKLYGSVKKARKTILKDHKFIGDVNNGQLKKLYLNLNNPAVIDAKGTYWSNIPIENAPLGLQKYPIAIRSTNTGPVLSTRSVDKVLGGYPESLPNINYDSAIFKDVYDYGGSKFVSAQYNKPGTVFDIQDPRMLKYADAITRDDAGNIIPLSKRDNFNLKDLRYILASPLIAGSTGYTLLKQPKSK